MILFSYTKIDGAEFIPHLDTLRHINRIIRRIGLPVNYSKGFNPHMLVYLSSPIQLGLKSTSEYCLIDTDFVCDNFKKKFNDNSPRGIKCVDFYNVDKKLNIANDITIAQYSISGFDSFDVDKILSMDNFEIIDKKGNLKNVRDKIYSLEYKDGVLKCSLKFGNEGLRIDLFRNKLLEIFSGSHLTTIKTGVKFLENLEILEYLGTNNG